MRRYAFLLVVGIILVIAGLFLILHGRNEGGMVRQPQFGMAGGSLILVGAISVMLSLRLLIKALARWEIVTEFQLARRLGPWFFYSVILLPLIGLLVYIMLNKE